MSYTTKMQLRMLLPCLMPVLFGVLVAWALSTIYNLPGALGGKPVDSQLPDYVFLGGLAITVLMMFFQCVRLWRWSKGEGEACYVCGCLLGAEKHGRWGAYRSCLGCAKNHSIK